MIKKILLVVVLLAVAGLAAVYFFGSAALNKGVKRGVESYGPRVTQTEVRLDEVDLSVFTGNGTLKGLTVGNPEGFGSENIFALGQVDVAVDLGTLTSDKIVIEQIHIFQPAISYERSMSGSNVRKLLENIEAFTGPADQPPAEEIPEEEEGVRKQVVIRSLVIEEGTVYVGALGVGRTVLLPRIEMSDIGEEGNRVTMAQAIELVLTRVLANIGPAIANAREFLEEGGNAALDAARRQGVERLNEATGDAADKASEGIKKLFGN